MSSNETTSNLETVFWAFTIITFIVVGIVILIAWSAKKSEQRQRVYARKLMGEPDEIDLRIPYKKFKELYPYSKLTYNEYKRLQMQKAFKKAVSSEKNKRMVR
ncbi:MAG: hypothetical protein QW270_04915 [Candidatus Bathyarchaeia archaeon]